MYLVYGSKLAIASDFQKIVRVVFSTRASFLNYLAVHLWLCLGRSLFPGSSITVSVFFSVRVSAGEALLGSWQRANAYVVSHPYTGGTPRHFHRAHGWLHLTTGKTRDFVIFNHVVCAVPPSLVHRLIALSTYSVKH